MSALLKNNIKKGILGSLFLSLILTSFQAKAWFDDEANLSSVQAEVEAELQQVAGNEAVKMLAAYKKEVEENAYKATLQLCEGYRRATNQGPHPYHGRYMYSFEEAMAAWGKVIAEGGLQTFNGIYGKKADYIHLQELGFFDFNAWFNSVYTLYLVNSTGFLQGAMHCLNSVNARDINKLAAAIVIADNESTLVTMVASGEAIGVAAKAIFKGLAAVASRSNWILRTGSYLRNTIWSKIRKPTIYVTTTGLAFGMGTLAFRKITANYQVENRQEEINNFLEHSPALDLKKLLEAFDLLKVATEKERLLNAISDEQRHALYLPFWNYVTTHFNSEEEKRLLENLTEFKAKNPNITAENTPIEIILIDVVFSQKRSLATLYL